MTSQTTTILLIILIIIIDTVSYYTQFPLNNDTNEGSDNDGLQSDEDADNESELSNSGKCFGW